MTIGARLLRPILALSVASIIALPSAGATRAHDQVQATSSAPEARDPRWATPRAGPGLHNFYVVSPTLYRGAQPTREGFEELRRLGVRTVVSLRAYHDEREVVAAAGLGYEHIPFRVWHPQGEDMTRFLRIVTDRERQPVFVHCRRGADRTGTAVAVYRTCVEGWSKDDAIDEMVNGGYGFARRFTHLPRFLRSLDIDAVLPAVPTPSDRQP